MKTQTVLQALSSALVARANCAKTGNSEWYATWDAQIDTLARDFLPCGSGFDSGTKVDTDRSDGCARIVLTTSFHHMNENGMYDGWTEHTVTVRPDLLHGFTLSISGRDRNQIKEYMHDAFHAALTEEIVIFPDGEIKAARWVKEPAAQS